MGEDERRQKWGQLRTKLMACQAPIFGLFLLHQRTCRPRRSVWKKCATFCREQVPQPNGQDARKQTNNGQGLSIALMCGGRIANSSDRSRTAIPIVFAVTCGHQFVTSDDSACTYNQAFVFVMTLLRPADFFDCSSKPQVSPPTPEDRIVGPLSGVGCDVCR